MNVDERKMLERALENSEEALKLSQEMHDAFFKEPRDGKKSFFQRASDVVEAAENGSWAIKWMVRIVLTVGAVVTAVGTFMAGWWTR